MEEKDLAIVIECEPIFSHNWMCFVSWYSIQKKLSSAQVFIKYLSKGVPFVWPNSIGVKKFIKTDRNIIKNISPSVIAAREFSGNLDIASSKTDIPATFVDYKFGCGTFELDSWINKKDAPFQNAHKKFSTIDLTINEYAVLDTWEQCCVAYKQLIGGSL